MDVEDTTKLFHRYRKSSEGSVPEESVLVGGPRRGGWSFLVCICMELLDYIAAIQRASDLKRFGHSDGAMDTWQHFSDQQQFFFEKHRTGVQRGTEALGSEFLFSCCISSRRIFGLLSVSF